MSRYEWNLKYILKTDNANLPVSVSDMKDYLRIIDNFEDNLVEDLIISASKMIENYTGIDILNKTYTAYADFFPFPKRYGNRVEENFNSETILIKKSKLQSITHIKYYINEVLTTLDDTLYDFTEDNLFARIYLINENSIWPTTDSRKQAIQIELVAGHGDDSSELPENIKLMIKRLVAYLYENRGDCVESKNGASYSANLSCIIPYIDQISIWEI